MKISTSNIKGFLFGRIVLVKTSEAEWDIGWAGHLDQITGR